MLIDTHSHLYVESMLPSKSLWMENLAKYNVSKVLLPNINLESIESMESLCEERPEMFHPMMGIHPCDINENYLSDIENVKNRLFSRPEMYCGVGEIGLDYHWDLTYQKEQIQALEIQFSWAVELDKAVSIHSRKSNHDMIPLLKKWSKKGLKGVMHCFTGSIEEAHQIIETGFYLGIGGVLTFPKAGLQEVIKNIDLKHIVLETDAPYIAPVPYRGKQNESGYVFYIAEKLAEIKQMSLEEVATITSNNATHVFSL